MFVGYIEMYLANTYTYVECTFMPYPTVCLIRKSNRIESSIFT